MHHPGPSAITVRTGAIRRLGRITVVAALMLVGAAIGSGAVRPYSSGITGYSGRSGFDCMSCHSGGTAPTVAIAGPLYVLHDSTTTFQFRVSGGQQVAAGLDVAVEDGTLVATDVETWIDREELTHVQPRPVDGAGVAEWSFDFVAPSAAGPLTMWAAGNSVDLTGDQADDASSTTTRTITVVDSLISFSEFGNGLAGSGGLVPKLTGIDGPSVGPWSVTIEDGIGGGSGYVWVGVGTAYSKLFKGDFYIDLGLPLNLLPVTLEGSAGVAGDGSLTFDCGDLSELAPSTFYAQCTLFDAAAPKRFSMSNALQIDIED